MSKIITGILSVCCAGLVLCSCQTVTRDAARIPGGVYVPFLDPDKKPVEVSAFVLDVYPVTQKQYLGFVKKNPEWQRSRIKRIFADQDYLKNWKSDFAVPSENAPVTYVSWFAANAYCEAQGKRLPTADEWDYVSRASEFRSNAEGEEAHRKRILNWYDAPVPDVLPSVGSTFKNIYGVFDMHGLIWEWVFDFNTIPKSDGRSSTVDLPSNLYCAGGVGVAGDPANYASFMRFAFRSSLKGSFTIKDLGFRCATSKK